MSCILAPVRSLFSFKGGSSSSSSSHNTKDRSQDLVARILKAHDVLIGLDDLSPGEVTNKTLGDLVALCCESHDSATVKKVLANRRIAKILPALRRISSESECCLETYWSERIVSASRDPEDALRLLQSFPYYQNYVELARLELCALYAVEPLLPRRIAFVGSGPLPLTSMCLLRCLHHGSNSDEEDAQDNDNANNNCHRTLVDAFGARKKKDEDGGSSSAGDVDDDDDDDDDDLSNVEKLVPSVLNVDSNPAALAASEALCEKLGVWSRGMTFQNSDAKLASGLGGFDVVFLAALVGVSPREKEDIIISVARRMKSGALMVVRSAHGLRTVLYPEVDLSGNRLRDVLQVETITHPYGNVVNSVIIARVK
ncbi:hypothetical protein PFICI_01262 [Pestalotiopsis fici W106-1]|uniref:Nicotianamine synthase n=1 Tax=Pestalotiopsis fici (strain W106-1 / CGMCC3.15140) TaxID=1229662 RepID=W3XN68_PESFW|nr:uncharacterized protein PFICI_01262 [Pestalotiopsis fici W106-1]ETS87434.1 hypothetical protein PFICI_01262 [Pestalotiopsis fici W106-1]